VHPLYCGALTSPFTRTREPTAAVDADSTAAVDADSTAAVDADSTAAVDADSGTWAEEVGWFRPQKM
jgi:hypothetical protein